MKDSKLLFFVLGAAVGAAAAYVLTSDKKDEIIEEVKSTAKKVKDVIDHGFGKGNDILDEIERKISE